MRANVNAMLCQNLLGYGTHKNQRSGQSSGKMPESSGKMPAAAVIIKAVIFYFAAVIGMPRPHHIFKFTVIAAVLVAVGY